MASGTFPYPYTATQYTPASGQPAYVPPIKYPYGAPALSVSTLAAPPPSAGTTPTSSTAQTQERPPYNVFMWKQPYTGPCDSTAPAESQEQSEPTSNDAQESTRNTDEVVTSTMNSDDTVPPKVPPIDNPDPTASTEGATA